jgi:hypothetical protein
VTTTEHHQAGPADTESTAPAPVAVPAEESAPTGTQLLEFGGLRFDVSFRAPSGATLRVESHIGDDWREVLRFDDFVDVPHYHAPADGAATMFDRAALGDPMEWYIAQIRDHLPEWLTTAGFADVIPTIDLGAVTSHADQIHDAMVTCVPAGYTRVPGVGLQRVGSDTSTDR